MDLRKYKIAVTLLLLSMLTTSCGEKSSKPCLASFEMVAPNPNDTVNRKDCDGWKQGKWIPTRNNMVKDTIYFKNDTIINSIQ